uniref:Protein TsetseEP domain-containing protein n=1 Tax=Anopheles funestus TaxID=62324 RepID=A0A4Y0BQ43_ANOFN
MNRLVLAFGIVCLLQGLSAEPRPQFGLENELPAGNRIDSMKSDVSDILNDIGDLTVTDVTSGVTNLESTESNIENFIYYFDSATTTLMDNFDLLMDATTGDIDGAFDPFIQEIDNVLEYLGEDGATYISNIAELGYSGISDELTDASEFFSAGLEDLKAKTETVKGNVAAAYTVADSADVDTATLRQYVTLSSMYNMLNSMTKLRSYLPILQYILETVIENIAEADSFVNELMDRLDNEIDPFAEELAEDIDDALYEIDGAIDDRVNDIYDDLSDILSNIEALSVIADASETPALVTPITDMKNLFYINGMDANYEPMWEAFDDVYTAIEDLFSSLTADSDLSDDPLTIQLVDTLVGNDKYGRYCYNKYKDLVMGLFDLSYNGAYLCVDKELVRIDHLYYTLMTIFDLLMVDYEDFEDQVGVCDSLSDAGNSFTGDCLSSLNTFYTALETATEDKLNLLFTIATDEAVAIENRLLMCFELVNLDVSVIQAGEISEGLAICAEDGPTGSD